MDFCVNCIDCDILPCLARCILLGFKAGADTYTCWNIPSDRFLSLFDVFSFKHQLQHAQDEIFHSKTMSPTRGEFQIFFHSAGVYK